MAWLRRNASTRAEGVTLFFASDIHGSDVCWRKFISAAKFYGADTLILGGDFTGKLVVPVVDQGGGTFHAHFLGKDHVLAQDDLPEFKRRVSDAGFYPAEMGRDRFGELEGDAEGISALFEELMSARLIEWIAWARERLDGTEVRVLTAPANDDPYFIDEVIESYGGDLFVNVENEVVEIAPGHEMISSGYTNRTPWNTPREFDEAEIKTHIDQMVERLTDVGTAVFNLHPPPFGTKLDPAPKLNEHLEVVTSTGATVMEHVGSTAVLAAIKEHQPLVSLHGHIHESAGHVRIGRTTAINPGSEYGEGILKGALVRIGNGRIQSYQATSG